MRILFTGGSGKAGKHVAPYLAEQGHHVTNADLVPLKHPGVADLRVDLTNAGEVYSALAGLATHDELELDEKPSYDAVVHFAAIPAILVTSDATTYATNTVSTYNVLEAATRLGIRRSSSPRRRRRTACASPRASASRSTCRSTRSTRRSPRTPTRRPRWPTR